MKTTFFSIIAMFAMLFVNTISSSAQNKKLNEENAALRIENNLLSFDLEKAKEEAKHALDNATWEDKNMTVDIFKGTEKATYWGPGGVSRDESGTYVYADAAKANESAGFCGGSSAKADAGSKPAKVADNTKAQTDPKTSANTTPVATVGHKKVNNKANGHIPSIKELQHYFLDHAKEAKQFASQLSIPVGDVTAWLGKAKMDSTVCGEYIVAVYCNKCDELEWDTVRFNGVPCIMLNDTTPFYAMDRGQLVGKKLSNHSISTQQLNQIVANQTTPGATNGSSWMNSRPADMKVAGINPLMIGIVLLIVVIIAKWKSIFTWIANLHLFKM